MDQNDIGERSLGCALKVPRALGPGLLESAYEACLSYELSKQGIQHQRQLSLPVVYDGIQIDLGYRLDLLIEGLVVVEVKAIDHLTEIFLAGRLLEPQKCCQDPEMVENWLNSL